MGFENYLYNIMQTSIWYVDFNECDNSPLIFWSQ
jgi:hypothetical protein